MTEPKDMTCEEFQAHMPELIGSGQDASSHPHVQNCDLCRALLKDLETIAEAARQLFPVEDPPDRLWESIQSAIQQEDAPSSSSQSAGAPSTGPASGTSSSARQAEPSPDIKQAEPSRK